MNDLKVDDATLMYSFVIYGVMPKICLSTTSRKSDNGKELTKKTYRQDWPTELMSKKAVGLSFLAS